MTLTPFESGLVAHLVADWILQNDWMTRNKTSLRHPAAWTHSAIHGLCLGVALGWPGGLVLGFAHLLIDTRVPATWWMRTYKRCNQAPDVSSVAVWLDQTLHILSIAIWVMLAAS
jgi:hypothetical protein